MYCVCREIRRDCVLCVVRNKGGLYFFGASYLESWNITDYLAKILKKKYINLYTLRYLSIELNAHFQILVLNSILCLPKLGLKT